MKSSSMILALETSTDLCSAALCCDELILERSQWAPREHTHLILGQVDELLEEAGQKIEAIEAFAFGCGPGTFTGVRVAAAIAHGMAAAHDTPLIPISSLSALAWRIGKASSQPQVLAVMDARLAQVYWGAYGWQAEALEVIHAEALTSITDMPAILDRMSDSWAGGGSGFEMPELLPSLERRVSQSDATLRPDARSVLELAVRDFAQHGGVEAQQAQPTYLRHPVRNE